MALDDQYANKFAPLDSTAIYPKPGQAFLYSTLDWWNETLGYTFALRISISTVSSNVPMQHMHRQDHQMIWSTSYHHVTLLAHRSWPHKLFTVALVHQRQILLKLHHLLDPSL